MRPRHLLIALVSLLVASVVASSLLMVIYPGSFTLTRMLWYLPSLAFGDV